MLSSDGISFISLKFQPSGVKFVLICSPNASTGAAKDAMKQIYAKIYVDLVVLADETESQGGDLIGAQSRWIANQEFADAAQRFLTNLKLLD